MAREQEGHKIELLFRMIGLCSLGALKTNCVQFIDDFHVNFVRCGLSLGKCNIGLGK